MARKRWLTLIVLACCSFAQAGVYRCEQDGKLQFSDKPCVAGQQPLQIAPPNQMETSAGDRALAEQFDDDTAALRQSRKVRPKIASDPVHATKAGEVRPHKERKEASPKSPKRASTTRAPQPPAKLRHSRRPP